MNTILIVCGAGASSTFLASRMRSLAATRGLQVTVSAASESELDSRLGSSTVLLVGPHLADHFDELAAQAADFDVASALLPADAFGPTGAEAALDLATGLAPLSQPASNN